MIIVLCQSSTFFQPLWCSPQTTQNRTSRKSNKKHTRCWRWWNSTSEPNSSGPLEIHESTGSATVDKLPSKNLHNYIIHNLFSVNLLRCCTMFEPKFPLQQGPTCTRCMLYTFRAGFTCEALKHVGKWLGCWNSKLKPLDFSIVLFKKKITWVSLISRKHHSKQAFRIFVFWCLVEWKSQWRFSSCRFPLVWEAAPRHLAHIGSMGDWSIYMYLPMGSYGLFDSVHPNTPVSFLSTKTK